jgi:hypothetical protein
MGSLGRIDWANGACPGKGQRRWFAPAGDVKGGVAA